MSKRPPLVEVEWLDARNDFGPAVNLSEIASRARLARRYNTGYLVYEGPCVATGEAVVMLAQTFDPPESEEAQDEVENFTVIPAGWVKTIKHVRKPRAKKGKANETPPSTPTAA